MSPVHNDCASSLYLTRIARSARLAFVVSAVFGVSACQHGAGQISYNMFVDPASLSVSLNGWTAFPAAIETAATTVRNSAVFQVQSFFSAFTGKSHFSLSTANVEYAHAAGITGAGQKIAIIDEGFLTSHEVFSGKSVTTYSSVYAPSGSDPCNTDPNVTCHGAHGTAVAAVAAGSDASGDMIGVAPGASLLLEDFSSDLDMASATNQAAAAGAIVQNNSWGYAGAFGTQSAYNSLVQTRTRNPISMPSKFCQQRCDRLCSL